MSVNNATQGNDTFTNTAGSDTFDGLQGTDTVLYSGYNYANGMVTVSNTGNLKTTVDINGIIDNLKWIEFLQFDNGKYDVANRTFVANPTISISDGQAIEGQGVNFTISLSQATDHDVTVTYFTQAGTATGNGTDYFGTPGTTVTIAAGQTSAVVSIATRDDAQVEQNENFSVNLTNASGATIADGLGVGTIVDNDVAPPPPHITMTAVTSAVVEGGTIQYLFTRTGGDLNSAFDVTWAYNPPLPSGAATPGVDFVDPASHVVHFAAGQTQATVNFVTIADGVYEGTSPALPSTEAFAITFVPDNSYTFSVVSNIATIVDGDPPPPPPVVSLTPAVAETTEGGALTFTFTRSGGDASQPLTINYIVNDGPPLGGATRADGDFSYASGIQQITFAAGETVKTITVQTNDDAKVEGDESFPVSLVGGLDYTVDPLHSGSTAVIHDNDFLPTLSIADASVNEEAGTITFTVTLSAAAAGPVTFSYSTADGTASSADYVGVANQLATIAAGDTSTTITIALVNDNIVETGGETFFVNLSNPAGATIADGQAVGTILEQDQLIVGTLGNDDGISNPLLVGGNGDDTIQGLSGDDGLVGGLGNDFLDGGAGSDRVIYTTAGAAVNVQLAAGTATIGSSVDTLRSIEFGRGTAFNDVYNASGFGPGSSPNASSEGNDFNGFEGLGGDDQITGNGNTRIEYTNATAAVTVNLAAPAAGAPAGATGFASGDTSVGNDTIFGGVNRVRGSAFADTMTGSGNNEVFEGRGGDDIIDGGAGGIDIALFTGVRSNYTITGSGTPGSSTVQDNVAGRDGLDSLTNIELTEFADAYVLNQRVLDLSTFGGLAAGKTIFGTNNNVSGAGDNLTLGLNASGRFIDLADGGTDTLTLATGGTYNLNLSRVEIVAGSGGNDLVTLQNGAFGMTVDLAGGTDALTLANGGNNVTVNGVETVTGGTGNDTVSVGSPILGMNVNLGAGIDSLNLANGANNVTVSGTENIHGGSASGRVIEAVTLGDATPVTINSIESVTGGAGDDQVTIAADAGVVSVAATLNLGGGNDTVNLNFFGSGTVASLGLTAVEHLTSAGGVQTVNLSSDTGLTTVDLGPGVHRLNLAGADHNNLSVANVFQLSAPNGHNDTIDFDAGPTVNQFINLGTGNDVLNLTGANDHLSMTIAGGTGTTPTTPSTFTIHDQTNSGNLDLNLLNQQGGAVYDLGAGTDSLHLNGNTGFTNVVFVQNVENVDSIGSASDQIHVLGNSGGPTTVTAGGGPDQIWASADTDHFRFTSAGDSPNDMPFGGQRDVISDFNAGGDAFVFDHIAGLDQSQFNWTEINFGGTDIVLVDIDGGGINDGVNYPGYEMAIQLENHTGTLTNANFLLL